MDNKNRRIGVDLPKLDAIFLVISCTAQMFAWTVNPGRVDAFKYSLIGISCGFMVLLLYRIWVGTENAARTGLIVRILMFCVLFNVAVFVICYFTGGVIAAVLGIAMMVCCLKIEA